MTHFFKTLSLSSLTLLIGMATSQAQNLQSISIHSLANSEVTAHAEAGAVPAIRSAAEDRPAPSKLLTRTYQWSVVALGAATAADMASSLKFTADGQQEANGLLSSRNGGYGAKGALLEAGIVGGSLLLQHFLIKGHPGLRMPFAISNFAISGFQAWNVHHNVSY